MSFDDAFFCFSFSDPWQAVPTVTSDAFFTAGLRFAFTTTHRMIDRVHGHTSCLRADSKPAASSRFAKHDVLVIGIAYDTDSCTTLDPDLADLSGGSLRVA